MNIRQALEKEALKCRKLFMRIHQEQINRNDKLFGLATMAVYRELAESYERIIKELDETSLS